MFAHAYCFANVLKTRKSGARKITMEGLLEQERELELQIDTYKAQVSQNSSSSSLDVRECI